MNEHCPVCLAAHTLTLSQDGPGTGASCYRAISELADASLGWQLCEDHDRLALHRPASPKARDMLSFARSLEQLAMRVRAVASLLAVLLLAGCDEWPLGAPPYAVCLDGSMPAGDREVWRAAEARWNVEIGTEVLLDETRGCDVHVRATSELDEPACTLPHDDQVRIFYVPASLEPCVALHELAHLLIGPGVHLPGTVLDEHGCDFAEVTAPVAQRAREKWRLQ